MRSIALLLLVLPAFAAACARKAAPPIETVPDAAHDAPHDGIGEIVPPFDPALADADEVEAALSSDAAVETRFDPADWEPAIGHWSFEDGELVTDGSVMSALIYRKGIRARDFDFTVQARFEKNEASAGVLFREVGDDFYRDATFYQFEWYTRGSHHDRRLSFMKKNPFWVQLVEPKYPEAPLATWIELRVRAEGDFVQTFVDGGPVFDKHDTTFVREGRIGLHCFMPRKVRFRRPVLRVW